MKIKRLVRAIRVTFKPRFKNILYIVAVIFGINTLMKTIKADTPTYDDIVDDMFYALMYISVSGLTSSWYSKNIVYVFAMINAICFSLAITYVFSLPVIKEIKDNYNAEE